MGVPFKVDWDTVPDLGIASDAELAKRYNVSTATVRRGRIKRGMSKRTDWSQYPLGEVSDGEIARIYGFPATSVASGRKALGIPAFDQGNVDWDAVEGLGVVPDAEIDARLGVSRGSAACARQRRLIPPCSGDAIRHPGVDWDALPLGEVIDREIAATVGCHESTVNKERRRRDIAPCGRSSTNHSGVDWGNVSELGTAPDGVVAALYGVHAPSVYMQRVVRQIPPFAPQGVVDWDAVPELGVWPDAWVGDKYGVTASAAGAARMYRQIEAACPEKATRDALWANISRK